MNIQDNQLRLKKVLGFKAQYERMLYALKIAEKDSDNLEQKEYELITFFQHCWNLRDHIRKDNEISEPIKQKVRKMFDNDPDLIICTKLANGTKHFQIGKNPDMVGNASVNIIVGGNVQYLPLVTYEDGRQINAIDVARKSAQAWENILNSVGLI